MERIGILALIIILVMGFCLVLACGGGDDDDGGDDDTEDDDDDDASPDDDDDDDNDDTAQISVQNLVVGECKDVAPDAAALPVNIAEVTWQSGLLKVERTSAVVNCIPDITVNADLSDTTLSISESDEGQADCVCTADMSYELAGVPGGGLTLQITYNSAIKEQREIAAFMINTDQDDYAWKLPKVIFLSQQEDHYYADQSIALRVNACHIEDVGAIQIYKVTNDASIPTVYTLDRRNLTNPGTIGDECVMLDYDMPGLSAGEYTLAGIGYDHEIEQYSISTSSLTVE